MAHLILCQLTQGGVVVAMGVVPKRELLVDSVVGVDIVSEVVRGDGIDVDSFDIGADVETCERSSLAVAIEGSGMALLVHLHEAGSDVACAGAHPDIARHPTWKGEEEERSACQGGVDDIHPRSAEDLLTQDYPCSDADGGHPVGDGGRKDQGIQDSCDEESFGDLMAAHAGEEPFAKASDGIGDDDDGHEGKEPFFQDSEVAIVFGGEGKVTI